jgi:uncharacterized protein (TIGR02246 family)
MKQVLLFFALLIATPALAKADSEANGKAAIEAHGRQWAALYEAGQIDEMRRLYEPDAWLMTHGAPAAKGVDAILAYLKRNKASGTKASFDFTPELITIDGNRGYLISKYWMTLTRANGEKVEAAGRSFLVFKRGRDGVWRLWRDMDNQAPDVRIEDRPGRG